MREWLTEDGLHPVRWNNQQFPWIKAPEDCRELWVSHLVRDEPDWDGLTLRESFDDTGALLLGGSLLSEVDQMAKRLAGSNGR